LEKITSGRSLVRLLAAAEVLDRVLAEKEFGARWEAFQRLRLVSKGIKAVVEALPEFRHMNKMRQLRQALHERYQVGKRIMAGGPRCMPIDVAF
jgi:hypothetical protein